MIHLLLAAVLLLLLPFLTGQGLMAALDDLQKKRAGLPEKYLSGSLVLLLLTEAAHLLTLIRGEGIAFCLKTAGLLWILVATVSYLFTLVRTFLRALKSSPEPKERKKDKAPADSVTAVFGAAAFLLIAAQLVYIALGSHVAITGDMTAETVQTLLGGAPFYETNPMTGLPYRAGIPSRLKILVLPSFYAIFARAFSLPATTVVWHLGGQRILRLRLSGENIRPRSGCGRAKEARDLSLPRRLSGPGKRFAAGYRRVFAPACRIYRRIHPSLGAGPRSDRSLP